jgi:chromosome segregation ATPase
MWLTSVVLGWRKGILHEGEILELLRRVFPRRGSRARKDDGGGTVDLTADPTEVLVRSLGSRIDARALLDLAEAARANAEEAAARQAVAEELKAQMEAKAIDLTRELEAHQQEIDRLGEAKRELEHRLADLDALNADIRTTFQHRLDETRGRLRGVLGGELSRWLESAYQASTLEPPRTEVIRERLETALGAIRRELEWLQTSE